MILTVRRARPSPVHAVPLHVLWSHRYHRHYGRRTPGGSGLRNGRTVSRSSNSFSFVSNPRSWRKVSIRNFRNSGSDTLRTPDIIHIQFFVNQIAVQLSARLRVHLLNGPFHMLLDRFIQRVIAFLDLPLILDLLVRIIWAAPMLRQIIAPCGPGRDGLTRDWRIIPTFRLRKGEQWRGHDAASPESTGTQGNGAIAFERPILLKRLTAGLAQVGIRRHVRPLSMPPGVAHARCGPSASENPPCSCSLYRPPTTPQTIHSPSFQARPERPS